MLKGQIPRPLVLLFCCFKAERRGAKRSQLFYSARIRPSPLPITINHSPSMSTIPISLTLGLTAVTCTSRVLQGMASAAAAGVATWPRMAPHGLRGPVPPHTPPLMALHGPAWPYMALFTPFCPAHPGTVHGAEPHQQPRSSRGSLQQARSSKRC